MRKLLMVMAVILAVLVATITQSSAQTINGCVNKKTGALRIATPCTKSETPISWNKTGPQGEKGDTGAQGPQGPPGLGFNPLRIALLRWYEANQSGNSFTAGASPQEVAFDGENIWVTNWWDSSVTKLRASDGSLVGTYGVDGNPWGVAFDGVNIWVTIFSGNTVIKF